MGGGARRPTLEGAARYRRAGRRKPAGIPDLEGPARDHRDFGAIKADIVQFAVAEAVEFAHRMPVPAPVAIIVNKAHGGCPFCVSNLMTGR